jgi:TrmH family RNA methyltransferase
MLSKGQFKLVRQLLTKKGRRETGKCLVEGNKIIAEIGDLVDFKFTSGDTPSFKELSSTQTSQDTIAVANIPVFSEKVVLASDTIILLDHVQDPGNVGAFFRLALAFDATLVLRECADPFSPKVIRASAGACFKAPNMSVNLEEAQSIIAAADRDVYKMEINSESVEFNPKSRKALLIFGNEGRGILGNYPGQSVYIDHNSDLESLNVSHAGSIALHKLWTLR